MEASLNIKYAASYNWSSLQCNINIQNRYHLNTPPVFLLVAMRSLGMENKSTKYIKSAFSILCKVEQTFQFGVTKGHKKHAMKEGGKFPGEGWRIRGGAQSW